MVRKEKEKRIAIKLRQQGCSYSEILEEVKVAKSTLSLWLRSVGLAEKMEQRLTEKKRQAQIRAVNAVKQKRLRITKKLMEEGVDEIGKISKRDLFIIGIVLYWAEGSKQKEGNVSQRVIFSNSDYKMIRIFIRWLKENRKLKEDDFSYELYVQENIRKSKIKEILNKWRLFLSLNKEKEIKVRLKKNITKKIYETNRNYLGVFRIGVARSTNLNRKINGWIKGITSNN